jgi:methyl-accepting chemotaxis protein
MSPCIAKRREFDETGLGDYNVTMLAMKNRLEAQRTDISSFSQAEYEGAHAERAVRFSIPGGLLDTAERFIPGIRRRTTKIEGVNMIYPYLDELPELLKTDIRLSLLIDCLNCEKGCNGGPGTGNHSKSMPMLENPIQERSAKLEEYHKDKKEKGEWVYKKYNKTLEKFWKSNLYTRTYRDRSENNTLKYPNETELKKVYQSLKKFSEADIYDCTSCGYGSCKSMATAIFNNLNKVDNCAQYNRILLEEEKKTVVFINQQLKEHIARALELIEVINNLVEKLNTSINSQSESVDESSTVTGKIVDSLKSTSDLSRKKRESVIGLIENAAKGQEAMQETIREVQGISESVDGIASAIKIISVIAANTNLLAMNAAIEAAHAGEAGKGFAVVADEIRRLSETTRENSRSISQTLSSIISKITTTTKRSGDAGNLINNISSEIDGVANTMTELIDTLGKLSAESTGITSSLGDLRESSSVVKTDYGEMLSLTDKLRYDINFLAAMSSDIVRAMENNDQELMARLFSSKGN